MATSWRKFTSKIPSICFSPTLRFLSLRVICLSALILISNIFPYLKTCDDNTSYDDFIASYSTFVRKFRIYFYTVCSWTFLHHFASAFPKVSLPGIIDFPLIIGEAVAFFLQAITHKWASPISTVFYTPSGACEMDIDQTIIPNLSAWLISISLVILAIMRFAEALESDGRYFWAKYDITGFKLTPKRTQYNEGTKPNGFKVMTGVHLWTEHFKGEERWLVLSRGILALFLMIVAIAFAFNGVIVDPVDEAVELPMKVTRALNYPYFPWGERDLYLVVGLNQCGRPKQIDFSHAITTKWYGGACSLHAPETHAPSGDSICRLVLVPFYCNIPREFNGTVDSAIKETSISVGINYTTLRRALGESENSWTTVQVMIGHYNDTSTVVRRTQAPVVLLPGMNLLGFAQQHLVRQFRVPRLATLGMSLSYDEFVVSEIIHLQPNSQVTPTLSSNDTASLLVFPRFDFSDLRTVHDYREKSVLKGFSSVGGLWTALGLFFAAIFGSSLGRVVFGVKLLSISGVAHFFSETTKRSYQERYSDIHPNTIDKGKDLDALISNHLLDINLFSEDTTRNTGQEQGNDSDIESSGKKERVDSAEGKSPQQGAS